MNKKKLLMIITGGTCGHIFPGILIAKYLMAQGWQIIWLGTADRIEADIVPKYNIKIEFIRIPKIRGQSVKKLILTPLNILNAYLKAKSIINKLQPNIVLCMGGYISGPGGLAAWSLGIPIIVHEQNSVAGLTNKWLSNIADEVLQGFFGAFPNAEVVGNPIRLDILSLPEPKLRYQNRNGPLRILIIGGSQGAMIFNHIIPKVAAKLGNSVIFYHQSGKGAHKKLKQAYSNSGYSNYNVKEFIYDMAKVYSWADIIICRSGALTVSEIMSIGLPAIFVPFQHKDKHQYWNALPLEKVGAAKIFEEKQFTVNNVVNIITNLNREKLIKMAECAHNKIMSNATELIANKIIITAKNHI